MQILLPEYIIWRVLDLVVAAKISQKPPPPVYLVKGGARMCLAVLGWKNVKILKRRKNALGMERPIGGVLITSEIIFMMGCTWSMILEIYTKPRRKSLEKKISQEEQYF